MKMMKPIYIKNRAIKMSGIIKSSFSMFYPEPKDYCEDLIFTKSDDGVDIYVGDVKLTSLSIEELRKIITGAEV